MFSRKHWFWCVVAVAVCYGAQRARAETAYTLEWCRQFGTSISEIMYGISADSLGNVYVGGMNGRFLRTPIPSVEDGFVAKYDAGGNLLWTREIGASGPDGVEGVWADGLGNVYVGGFTVGGLVTPNVGGADAFVSKYDAAGNLLWIQQLGGNREVWLDGISGDALGNVFVGGHTSGSLGASSLGSGDAFVSKYNADGNLLWIRQFGTSQWDEARGVSADGLGNVYVTGYTQGSLAGPNAGWDDVFVAKYDTDGDLLWSRQLGTSATDLALGVSADSSGNLYVVGCTASSLAGPHEGRDDAFIVKYDGHGNLLWTRQFGTTQWDFARGVSSDGMGNVFVGGGMWESLGGANAGYSDAFVAQYDSDGNLQWIRQLGTSENDSVGGVSTDGLGNVYVAGDTKGSLGGPSAGDYDVFVAKFVVPEPSSTVMLLAAGALGLLICRFRARGATFFKSS